MKQRETLPPQKRVAFFLALGVLLAWSIAVIRQTIIHGSFGSKASSPPLESLSPSLGTWAPPSLSQGTKASPNSSAPPSRPARLTLARQAADQTAKAYQQALQTIAAPPPAESPLPSLAGLETRLPLPRATLAWPTPKPAPVAAPSSPPTSQDQASLQLRLTLPYQVFASPQAASEAAQLIVRQLVEQGYRPTLIIGGEGSDEGPTGTSQASSSTPTTSAVLAGKGETHPPSSRPLREANPPESTADPSTTAPAKASLAGGESPTPPTTTPPPPSSAANPIQELLTILRNAVAAEFRAYQALPALQTEELAMFFSGSAYQSAVAQLRTFQVTGQILSNPRNPSFSRFQGIVGPVSIDGDTATVTGREGRALHWYIPALQSYAPHTGQREYISYRYRLQRQEGRWKVLQRVRL